MKKKRFTEEQIAFALRQAESGTPVAEIIRKIRISEVTFYRWKKKYAGLGIAELRRLKQLEDENRPHSSLGNIPPEEYVSLNGLKETGLIRASEAVKNDLQILKLT